MKRAIFAVLVVLLALLAVACDSAVLSMSPALGPGQGGPTDEPTVSLSIGIAGSRARAMVGTDAPTDADFYEVVFVSGNNNVYRQTWDTSGTPINGNGGPAFTMTVAEGAYTNATAGGAGSAIMFAGKNNGSDKTLLGVGTLTGTNAGAGTTISDTTTSLTFTVTPLTAAVTTDAAISSFTITSASASSGFGSSAKGISTEGTTPAYPLFQVPVGETITAAYKFASSLAGTTSANVLIKAAGSVYLTASNASSAAVLPTATAGTAVTKGPGPTDPEPITPVSGNLGTALTSGFTLTFDAGATADEFFKLWIEVPVIAVSAVVNGATAPTLKPNATAAPGGTSGAGAAAGDWFIRGGINNNMVDSAPAATPNDKGGAVLLKVVDPSVDDTVNVTVTPTP